MKDLRDLWDHVAYMILCAPDSFPKEDFLDNEDQMTLSKGFDQLREGVWVAYPKDKYSSVSYDDLRHNLLKMLNESEKKYLDGDIASGARLIREFERAIFISKGKVRLLTIN